MISNELDTKTNRISKSGFTLIELMISILVGTVVISILMQQLVLTVEVRRNFEYDNRLANESYYIAEKIKFNIFNLQPHSIEVITDNSTETVINIIHEYDIESGPGNTIVRNYSAPVINTITWNKTNQTLTYTDGLGNTENLSSSNIKVIDVHPDGTSEASSLSIIRIDPATCLADPNDEICGEGILKLVLVLRLELTDGALLEPQTYITTIII